MNISRLAPAAPTTYHPSTQVAAVRDVGSATVARRDTRAGEGVERAVQGELLPRERTLNPSTQAWLDARALEHALPGEGDAGISYQARSAILGYLNNTRPETIADLLQGQSVNDFV